MNLDELKDAQNNVSLSVSLGGFKLFCNRAHVSAQLPMKQNIHRGTSQIYMIPCDTTSCNRSNTSLSVSSGVPHTKKTPKQNKTKQNKTKQNKTKQNKTKQNKTKQNKTKQNKTKQNKTKQNKT